MVLFSKFGQNKAQLHFEKTLKCDRLVGLLCCILFSVDFRGSGPMLRHRFYLNIDGGKILKHAELIMHYASYRHIM